MFTDFSKISRYFYDLLAVANYDLLKEVVKKNNVVQKSNARTEPSISIRTGIIPFEDATVGTDFYENNFSGWSGFSCVIIIDSGKKETSQEAFNIVATISQRVKYIFQNSFSDLIKIDDIPCNICSIQEVSDIAIEDGKSEFVFQMFVINGIFNSIKN